MQTVPDSLFRPDSVAIIGAGEKPGQIGSGLVLSITDGEFRDEDFGHLTCDMRIWCVHLHETEDPLNNLYLYLNADTGDLLGTRRVTD